MTTSQFTSVLVLGFAALAAQAQPFSVDWHKIAGGGGTSTGGVFSLSGTIGQHDAGAMSGGTYAITGGFWSGITLVQTPGAPQLSIQFAGGNAVISWAADASAGFVLDEALNVNTPASWGASAASVQTNGNVKSVTIPAAGVKFYRLRKP
jgi:hypothetical protein